MTRLIVEEGGQRRGFKVGDGILTIGSGPEARLRVSATDVAEIHAELEVTGGRAVVRSRPGVVAPTVGGKPVPLEAPVGLGQEVRIGSVRLWLEEEGQPAAPAPAAPAGVSRTDRAVRRERAIADAKGRRDRSVVQRSKPRVRRGIPAYLLAVLILAGALVAAFAGWRAFRSATSKGSPVPATLAAVQQHIVDGSFDVARTKLAALPADLTPEQRARADELRAEIARSLADVEGHFESSVGTQFFDVKLVKYEQIYLQGSPSPAKVREFLERCREFKTRWPRHPERDWVERQERRFAGSVDLAALPSLEDVLWKVECLTRNNPKEFKRAFAALDAFLAHASGSDAAAAAERRATLVEERKVNHLDRMQQAEYEYHHKQDVAQAVRQLVNAILYNGDEAMIDEAADILVRLDGVRAHLEGYKVHKPEVYAELIQHSTVARFAKEQKL